VINNNSPDVKYYKYSTFFEQMTEHVFISEVLQEAFFRYGIIIEVLRSEIDTSGYDIVLECNGFPRHIQLKTSKSDSKTINQNINSALLEKPSGCVIWILREEPDKEDNNQRMKLSYLYFGDKPGKALPSLEHFRVGKHAKANSKGVKTERQSIRVIPKSKFEIVPETKELLEVLFGL
jgi:hypothetical protein